MKISFISDNMCSFGSKKSFKKLFDKCAYSGGQFEHRDTRTIEHIIPVINGGVNDYSNYLVVRKSWNEKRSSTPLDVFIKENPQVQKNIIETVESMEGKIIEGINWAEEVKKTLIKAAGYDFFKNNQMR